MANLARSAEFVKSEIKTKCPGFKMIQIPPDIDKYTIRVGRRKEGPFWNRKITPVTKEIIIDRVFKIRVHHALYGVEYDHSDIVYGYGFDLESKVLIWWIRLANSNEDLTR